MKVTVVLDGEAHPLGPRASRMAEWLTELGDRIERAPVGRLELKFNADKIMAELIEACGIKFIDKRDNSCK